MKLTEKQLKKLNKAETKFAPKLSCEVTDDKAQILINHDEKGTGVAVATKQAGGFILAHCSSVEDKAALNLACAAVWGKQPVWPN